MPDEDLPDIAEIRTTLSFITGRTNPDARTAARDGEVLARMQGEVNEVLRRDRPADYASDDELRALLDEINNALGDE